MFAAGERRGAGKAEQIVREGVEPQRRLKRIRSCFSVTGLTIRGRSSCRRRSVLPRELNASTRAYEGRGEASGEMPSAARSSVRRTRAAGNRRVCCLSTASENETTE